MKLHYYPETDSLYVELKGGPGTQTREIVEGEDLTRHADARARRGRLAHHQQGQAGRLALLLRGLSGVYDNTLRKRTGSYYTPPEVVSAMVNLVDEALRGPLFERPTGFAADVVVADPAVGTGTFLLGVLRRIAQTVEQDQGAGAVRGAIEAAAKRVIEFEIQFGPFAVAQLRLIAELPALMGKPPLPELRL